ncbi:MAG: hypothetical protein U0031_19590 [Thermomicrobiales bacterium]
MILKLARFISLLLGALSLALAWAHLVEMRPKRSLPGAEWLTTLQTCRDLGKVASIAFPAALLSTLTTLGFVHTRRMTAVLTAIGAACTAATVAIWARCKEPVNRESHTWQADDLPANWRQRRDQWEFAHDTSAALHAAGFTALLAATLRDRDREDHEPCVVPERNDQ